MVGFLRHRHVVVFDTGQVDNRHRIQSVVLMLHLSRDIKVNLKYTFTSGTRVCTVVTLLLDKYSRRTAATSELIS